MNILPFVLAILLVFSYVTTTFVQGEKSLFIEERSIDGFHRAERATNNLLARRLYNHQHGKLLNKKGESSCRKKKNKQEYFSKRNCFPPHEEMKLHLGSFVEHAGEPSTHPLYESFATFLRLLYKEHIFSKYPQIEKIEYRLINAMVDKAKKHPGVKRIAELYPEDPELSSVFHKMLQGTNQYDGKRGIPPLEDVILLGKKKEIATLSFASPLLLETLFGQQIATEIQDYEKKKWKETGKYHAFSKEDLQKLASHHPGQSSLFDKLSPLLEYSKKYTGKTEEGSKDDVSGLRERKKISS